MNTGKNPWLGSEPLRESHLETLNDFTSRMEVAMNKAHLALTRASMMPIGGKALIHGQRQHLAQCAEHHYNLSDEEIRPQVA